MDGVKRRNVRTLLTTLDQILWDGARWTVVSLSQLLTPADVKKHYRKAIMLVHPDRHTADPYPVQVVAERCMTALKEQYDEYQKTKA